MRSAPVGHQCVDCVNEGARSIRKVTNQFGGSPVAQPYVTYVLIALNLAVFVIAKAVSGSANQLVLHPGAIAVYDEYYRLITSGFLHVQIMHILFNMVALYFTGPALERGLGHARFLALYLLSLLGGSVLAYLLSPIDTGTLGASGAVYGLFGAAFVLARKLRFDMKGIIALLVVNLVITFAVPGISWQGHFGGLVVGAAVAAAYGYAPRQHRTLIQAGATVLVLIVLAGLVWWRTEALMSMFYG